MGLFSKLKSNMDGGVQVHIQAPSSTPSNQVIPVTVTITADSSQTINNVKAEIKAQAREQGFHHGQRARYWRTRRPNNGPNRGPSRESRAIHDWSWRDKTVNLQTLSKRWRRWRRAFGADELIRVGLWEARCRPWHQWPKTSSM